MSKQADQLRDGSLALSGFGDATASLRAKLKRGAAARRFPLAEADVTDDPSPVPSLRIEPYEEVHGPGPFELGNAAPRTRRPTPPLAAPGLAATGWENRAGVGAERDVAPTTPRRGSAEDGDEGPNPLIVAAKEGRASQVAAILRGYSRLSGSAHSLAVDCRTHHGETPLVRAAWGGQAKM